MTVIIEIIIARLLIFVLVIDKVTPIQSTVGNNWQSLSLYIITLLLHCHSLFLLLFCGFYETQREIEAENESKAGKR